MKCDLTTTLHFHYQACESGNTLAPHTRHQNLPHILVPTMDGTLLRGPHWGPWILPSCGPVHGSQYPPYMAGWWHMAQLQHAIVPKCRPGVGTKYLSKDVQDIRLNARNCLAYAVLNF